MQNRIDVAKDARVPTIFTIGFTRRTAANFFDTLAKARISRLVDTRLNNRSQLAGFTKSDDLRFFTETILRVPYEHRLDLAPTAEILDAYKKGDAPWTSYEEMFLALLRRRQIEQKVSREHLDQAASCVASQRPSGATADSSPNTSQNSGHRYQSFISSESHPTTSARMS